MTAESVFGEIGVVPSKVGVGLFEITIAVLILIEICLEKAEKYAKRNNLKELFEKLKDELLQLGIISFLLFLAQSGGIHFFRNADYFKAFELTHVIVLFIAFAFVVQAGYLVEYAHFANRSYLRVTRLVTRAMLQQYEDLTKAADWLSNLRYNHVPSWTILAPGPRLDLESKTFEKIILLSHHFPADFDSAKYMKRLFQKYIANLGDISKTSWFALAVCGLLNYLRITIIDPHVVGPICNIYSNSVHRNSTSLEEPTQHDHRRLSDHQSNPQSRNYGAMKCPESILVYAFIVGVMLSLFIIFIFAASIVYYNALVRNALKDGGIDWEISGNKSFYEYLMLFEKKGQKIEGERSLKELAAEIADEDKQEQHEELVKQIRNSSIKNRKALKETKSSKKHIENEQLNSIFLFGAPILYFKIVELGLFFQCVYISIVATQLLQIALTVPNTVVWWFAFIVTVLFNFYLIRQSLHKSVLIQSVLRLDKQIFSQVCEEAAFEQQTVAQLGARIRLKMDELGIGEHKGVDGVKLFFSSYDKDRDGELDPAEFLALLAELNFFMTQDSFQIMWEFFDHDLSGSVTWDEVAAIVFPEMRATLSLQSDVAEKKRSSILLRDELRRVSKDKDATAWEMYLQQQRENIATEHSGCLSNAEFCEKIAGLGVKLPQRALNAVFDLVLQQRVNSGFDEEKISVEEYEALVCPELGIASVGKGEWDEEKGEDCLESTFAAAAAATAPAAIQSTETASIKKANKKGSKKREKLQTANDSTAMFSSIENLFQFAPLYSTEVAPDEPVERPEYVKSSFSFESIYSLSTVFQMGKSDDLGQSSALDDTLASESSLPLPTSPKAQKLKRAASSKMKVKSREA